MTWTIDGLPLHPLLVHAAVVLLAVNALALLGSVVVPRFRGWLGWGLPLLAVVTAATGWLTKMAGENFLGGRTPVGELAEHTHWGGWAGVASLVLGGTTVVYWFVMLPGRSGKVGPLRIVVAIIAVVVALAALVVDFLAGHSGAASVWG